MKLTGDDGRAGSWVGFATALGATGALAFSPHNPVPLIGLLCTVPLVVTGALWLASPTVRAALQLAQHLARERILGNDPDS